MEQSGMVASGKRNVEGAMWAVETVDIMGEESVR
jgi:hypothetical protein